MRDVLSQAQTDTHAAVAQVGDDVQAARIREALEGQFVCPFCGAVSEGHQTVCPRCTMENTPVARKATKARIGPWYVLQSRNPAAPGMKWDTLLAFVNKGRVKPQSIIRGPTTHQLWRFAAHVKGLSREFGVCYSCGGAIETSANLCSQCNRLQEPPLNPDTLLEGPEPDPRIPVFKEIPPAQAHAAQLAQAAPPPQPDEREQAILREQRESAAREREELLRQRDQIILEREQTARERDEIARQLEAVAVERERVHQAKRSTAGELDAVKNEQEAIARDREAAARERELAAQEREMIERDREAATHERLIVEQEREMIQREREAASTERLTVAQERETIERDRLALAAERDAILKQREAVLRDREAAAHDREAAAREREAVAHERDAATREREALQREMLEAASRSEVARQNETADSDEAIGASSSAPTPPPLDEAVPVVAPPPPIMQPKSVTSRIAADHSPSEAAPDETGALDGEENSDTSTKEKSVWDVADGSGPHKSSVTMTPFASASEKAEAPGLRPRPRDGFLSAKDLAAAFKLNFEPSAQYDAAQELLADLAPDPLSALRPSVAQGAPRRSFAARLWKWAVYLIILAAAVAALMAIDPGIRDRVRNLWSGHLTHSAAERGKSAPVAGPPSTADEESPSHDAADNPAALTNGAATSAAHAVATTRPANNLPSIAPTRGAATPPPSAVSPATVFPTTAPAVQTSPSPASSASVAGPATAPAGADAIAEPLPADPRQRSRTLYRAAIDAEDRNDFAQASRLYEEIRKLPSEDWPPDLLTRLKLARQQQGLK